MAGGRRSPEYRTQAEAEHAARSELIDTGGGELVVKGKDGKVRDKTTVGRVDAHKGAQKSTEPPADADSAKAKG